MPVLTYFYKGNVYKAILEKLKENPVFSKPPVPKEAALVKAISLDKEWGD